MLKPRFSESEPSLVTSVIIVRFFCIYNTDIKKKNELGDGFTFQPITELGLALFKLEVERQDWSSIFGKTTADDAYNSFLKMFLRLYEKCFPLKTVRRSKKVRKPWVSLEHLKMIKHKNSLYHSFQRTQSEETLNKFEKLRNNINKKLRLAKAAYYQNLFADASQKRPVSTWNVINKILGRNCTSSYPSAITYDSVELTGESLADHFNDYFVNIVRPSANVLPIRNKQSGPVQSIFLTPTDETEIYSTFMNMRNSTATDVDHLQIKPIKYVISSISRVLAHIFNLVLETGIFPSNMKKAKVSVIHKGGDTNVACNYRPISVLPVFSKGLEKIIFARVTTFLEKNNTLTDFQFGFRKGKSTETALLAIKENLLQNIQNNLYTIGVLIDLSKAFDCINHDILINKLSNIGIRGSALSLFDSYLRNRSQCVCIQDYKSSFLSLNCGVPQGSILGPLLFNVFINDVADIDPKAHLVMYADDITLLLSGTKLDDIIIISNEVLSKLSRWAQLNDMKINPSKTKAVIFCALNKKVSLQNSIYLENQLVEIVHEHKILGVPFSSNLSWNTHIDYICKKLAQVNGVLFRCRSLIPLQAKLQIYYALFHSRLTNCSLVWGTTTTSNINRLTILQKKIIRVIDNIDRMQTTKEAFAKYNIVRFDNMYQFRLLDTMYYTSSVIANYLKQLAGLQSHYTNVNTRNPILWAVPSFRTNYKLQSLTYNIPTLLNQHKNTSGMTRKELRNHFVLLQE